MDDMAFIKRLGNRRGYFELFLENLPKFGTQKKAFYWLEDCYQGIFGEYRFTSFESFRVAFYRYLKSKQCLHK